jgi:ABC-type transporter Mla subunit MlaD
MSELIKALIDQSEKKIEEIIKQLSAFASKQRYQLQCVILNHIIEKTFQLNIKTKEFWHYVKTNIESWDSFYQNERAFEEAFSTLSNVINSIAKARNIYEKTFKKINALWSSAKEAFARNQFVQVLRSLRRCALRNMTLKEACRAVAFAVENRLNNSIRDVSINRKLINRDWIKIINENYDLR